MMHSETLLTGLKEQAKTLPDVQRFNKLLDLSADVYRGEIIDKLIEMLRGKETDYDDERRTALFNPSIGVDANRSDCEYAKSLGKLKAVREIISALYSYKDTEPCHHSVKITGQYQGVQR